MCLGTRVPGQNTYPRFEIWNIPLRTSEHLQCMHNFDGQKSQGLQHAQTNTSFVEKAEGSHPGTRYEQAPTVGTGHTRVPVTFSFGDWCAPHWVLVNVPGCEIRVLPLCRFLTLLPVNSTATCCPGTRHPGSCVPGYPHYPGSCA